MNIKYYFQYIISIFLFIICVSNNFAYASINEESNLPAEFVYLYDIDPTIIQEIRYAGFHNFVGKPITGYLAPKCILTAEAAKALKAVQEELKIFSMTLKVYDCYRPQMAVDNFVEWAKNSSDTKMKAEFYPKVDKKNLFRDGYIAEKSGHSRGSTVDLTIVPLPVPQQSAYKEGQKLFACDLPVDKRFQDNSLNFGTGYDCFDTLSHTANPKIGRLQKQNRLMLKALMEKNGFKNLPEEWWHYTLIAEPFPDQYFNFKIQ